MAISNLIANLYTVEAAANAASSALSGISAIGAPSGAAPIDDATAKRAELNIIELDETAAKISADVDQHKELVKSEEAVATKIGEHISDLQNTLTESNDQLAKMREAAGLSDSSGVGAEKKKLTDDLNEARARLQYLEDKSKGTAEDLKAIEEQKKAVTDLTAQLTDAEKRLRIADYELTHSDAWQKQLQAIADQQAVIKAEQQKQADEKKHLDEMKEDLAAREAKAQKVADDRAAQQAILDKQQQDAQAAATAQRKADLEKELGDVATVTTARVGIIHAAAAAAVQTVQTAVSDAGTQLQDVAAQVSTTIANTATQAVETAGTAIKAQVSSAMKSLLDLVGGGSQTSQDVQGGPDNRDIGSQFAGQFFDETGKIAGGSITDATYADYVKSYETAKKRYADDYKSGNLQDQFAEARQMMQLEMIWQQLGGFARFNSQTLEQIVSKLNDTNSAINSVRRTVSAPPPLPRMTPERALRFKPTIAPKKDDSKTMLQVLIRTGQL
jgi:hypothetical protein